MPTRRKLRRSRRRLRRSRRRRRRRNRHKIGESDDESDDEIGHETELQRSDRYRRAIERYIDSKKKKRGGRIVV